jgi:hypothetical protein
MERKLEIKSKGRKSDTVEEIQGQMRTVLNTLTKKHFQDAFHKWHKRWDGRVRLQRDYFEGEGVE